MRRLAGLVSVCLTLAACTSLGPASGPAPGPAPAARPAPESPPAAPPGPDRVVNPWAEPARDVLVQHCGNCHRGDLPTSVKGALAVYDLSEPIWYARLSPGQYDGILERVHEARAIGPEDVAAIEAFVACARGGVCPPSD